MVLRNELVMIPTPTAKIDRNDAMLKVACGRHRDVAHSSPDFTAESTMLCHTIAHAP